MIYILRFRQPLGNPTNRRAMATYYVGWCKDGQLDRRIKEHRAGLGAAICRAANNRGIDYDVVVSFPGTRETERQIKRRKNTRRFLEQAQRNPLPGMKFYEVQK